MRLSTILSFVICTIGIALIIVCLSTDYWASRTRGLVKVHEGVWNVCRRLKASSEPDGCNRIFSSISEAPGKLLAVIVLLLLTCLFHLLDIAISCLLGYLGRSSDNFICIMQVLTTCCAMAGLSTYVKYYNRRYYRLDWSYIVGWVGVTALFVGLVFMIVGIERKRSSVV